MNSEIPPEQEKVWVNTECLAVKVLRGFLGLAGLYDTVWV